MAGVILLALQPGAITARAGEKPEAAEQKTRDYIAEVTGRSGARSGTGVVSAPSVDPLIPAAPDTGFMDAPAIAKYREALTAYYAYAIEGYRHREEVLKWQHQSTVTIFFVVLVLVSLGIYFAAVQFHHGLRREKRTGKQDPAVATEVELSLGAIKVSSPILGVVILVVSLAFFYLYLVYVYPVKDVF